MKKHHWPILTLLLLAPVTGELLSGYAPPAEFFTPFGLIVLTALYGSGVLIVRDLARRWGKSWASILLLGMAYGIYEEGIVVRSFFDPGWPDLGILATYGRWLGVNWVWSVGLTLYHAVVSIAIPIMLVELLFPAHRDAPWLCRPGYIVFSVLLLATMVVGPLVGMRASLLALWACIVAIGLLALLARLWPVRDEPRVAPVPPACAGWFFLLGFLGMLNHLITFWLLPEHSFPVLLTLGQSVAVPALIAVFAWALGGRAWTDRQRWWLVAGALLYWVLLAFLQELDNANRPDNTVGMALVGLAYYAFVIGLGVRVWRRTRAAVLAAPG